MLLSWRRTFSEGTSIASQPVRRPEMHLTLERRLFATPGAPGAGQGVHFRLSTWFLRDTEVIATNDFFFKNSGRRFLTDTAFQNTNNMKDRLIVKINQRHKFSNCWGLFHQKYRNSCLWFILILKAVYKLSLSQDMFWIKKRRPHISKNKSCHLQFCESYKKTSKFKVPKNLKICAFDLFLQWVDLSCYSCFEKLYLSENGAPYFWKKAFVESRKWRWKSKMATLSRTRRPRVKRKNLIRLKKWFDNKFSYDFQDNNCGWERSKSSGQECYRSHQKNWAGLLHSDRTADWRYFWLNKIKNVCVLIN